MRSTLIWITTLFFALGLAFGIYKFTRFVHWKFGYEARVEQMVYQILRQEELIEKA